jgi:hypothetical protein
METEVNKLRRSLLPKGPKAKRVGIVALAGSLCLGSVLLGLEFGNANSPDYSREKSSLSYLVSKMQLEKFSDENVVLTLEGGPRIYSYSLKDDALKIEVADPWTFKVERRWATFEYKRVAEITGISVTQGGLLATALEYQGVLMRIPVPSKYGYVKYGLYLVAAVVGVSGGYVGYYLSYEDKADYGNPTFRRILEDKSTWKKYAQKLSDCRKVFRSRDEVLEINKTLSGVNEPSVPTCEKYYQAFGAR